MSMKIKFCKDCSFGKHVKLILMTGVVSHSFWVCKIKEGISKGYCRITHNNKKTISKNLGL